MKNDYQYYDHQNIYMLPSGAILWATSRQLWIQWKTDSSTVIDNDQNKGKYQKRNTIWFNAHYSKSMKTNSGKYLLRLLKKHFPPGHKLCKIFNKNNLKLSCSYMPNLKAKINGNKKKILEKQHLQKQKRATVWKKKIAQ